MEKKLISDYSLFCTEEQTIKALELGAQIEDFDPDKNNGFVYKGRAITYPTAEQMRGWLEGNKIFIHIDPISDICCNWYISSKGYNKYGYTSRISVCKSSKEATLAAIDAALDYLEKQKGGKE